MADAPPETAAPEGGTTATGSRDALQRLNFLLQASQSLAAAVRKRAADAWSSRPHRTES